MPAEALLLGTSLARLAISKEALVQKGLLGDYILVDAGADSAQ